MVNIQGLTIGELAELYHKQTPDVKEWIRDNIHLWWGKEKPE